jgi:hypothetical protein
VIASRQGLKKGLSNTAILSEAFRKSSTAEREIRNGRYRVVWSLNKRQFTRLFDDEEQFHNGPEIVRATPPQCDCGSFVRM